MTKKKKKQPLKSIYVLYDNDGEWAGTYDTWDEADGDAVGPRFRPKYTVREYRLVLRKDETLRK